MTNARAHIGLASIVALVTACSGAAPVTSPTVTPVTATASPSASPTASPTPTPSVPPTPTAPTTPTPPPTPAPSPTIDPTTWATEICDINADYLTDSQAMTADIPAPADPTLASIQQMHQQRRPRVDALIATAVERTRAVERIAGGDPFQDALAAEFANQQATTTAFYEAIANATSLADIDAAIGAQGAGNLEFLKDSSRAVVAIPLPLADAIAAIDGCRVFEFDARARVRGAATATFTERVIEDGFEKAGVWKIGPFDGGTVAVENGKLSIQLSGSGASHTVTTSGHAQTAFGDVRLEATFSLEPNALSGLACRSTGGAFYTVQVNPIGLLLMYRWAPRQTIIGRRTLPNGAIDTKRIQLAIECAGGRHGEPLVIAVDLDGERVAEVLDDHPLAPQGLAGMFAQTVGLPSTTSYDDIAILVPAD